MSEKELSTVHEVRVYRGPRGGFRCLSYGYYRQGIPVSVRCYDKNHALSALEQFVKHDIPVSSEAWK